MPSTSSRGRKLGLWVRMLAACALLAVVGAALLAAEGAFFGVISYGALRVLTPVATTLSPDPAAGLVAAVVAYCLLIYTVLGMYRAARESPYGYDVLPDVFVYVPVALIGASLAVTYWVIVWLGLPRWVFGMVVVTLIAMAYPMAGYLITSRSSGDADGDGDDDSSRWTIEDPEESEGPTVGERVDAVLGAMGRMLRDVADLLGTAGCLVAVLAALGSLVGLYVAASVASPSSLVVPTVVAMSLVVVVAHVVDVVRTELSDVSVVRELDEQFGEVVDEAGIDGEGGGSGGERSVAALQARVDRLAAQADTPSPTVRLVRAATPTAAAAGYRPSTSMVVVTTRLVETLADDELDAVLAHELAHVANRDAAVLTALTFPRLAASRAFVRYGFNPVMALFAGLVSLTSRFCSAAVARAREHAADDGAVAITGDPAALASALERLDNDVSLRPAEDLRTAAAAFSIVPPPWEEHRFFDRTRRIIYRGLLGTHPPTDERIERLRARAREQERE